MIEIQTRPVTEQVTPLKLSEALRLGAMTTEQTFGVMERNGRYCAVGTILHAMGLPLDWKLLRGCGPSEGLFQQNCLSCGHHSQAFLIDLIVHLNDFHRLPREEIADLLEQAGL